MLAFPAGVKVYLAIEPVDMRKPFKGLNSDIGVKPVERLPHVHRLRGQVIRRRHRTPPIRSPVKSCPARTIGPSFTKLRLPPPA